MKRLLFICHGAGNGGAERVITTLSSEFAKRNYEVLLVTTNADHNDYDIYEKVKRKRIICDKGNKLTRTISRITMLRSCIKEFNPDVIISFSSIPNIQSIIASILMRSKIIISERTDPSKYPSSMIGKALRRILYPIADRIVFQTQDAMNYFDVSISKKGTIIPNPIRDDLPERHDGEREKRIIGIGSLGEQKNWIMALKACEIFFQHHPDYIFELYGEGPHRSMLQDIINKSSVLSSRVYLKGFSKDVVNILQKSAIYLSTSKYEGISNSMLEALAVGTPVICTDCPVGGARQYIVNGQNGFLVQIDDYMYMAELMCKLISDKNLSMNFSVKATQIRHELRLNKILDMWEKEVISLCLMQ